MHSGSRRVAAQALRLSVTVLSAWTSLDKANLAANARKLCAGI